MIVFITRKFPPSKGGMENVAYELYKHLSKIEKVELIKWGGSNKFLPIVLPFFLIKSLFIILTRKADIDVIYLQDGLLSPLGVILKIFGKPIIITIHGLDITHKNKLYQAIVPNCVKRMDKIVCISNATKQECIKRGVPEEKIIIIPNGISDVFYINSDRKVLKKKLENKINLDLENKKILLSIGRLVERKGFHWFVNEVMPKLIEKRKDLLYLIAGDGKYRSIIENAIKEKGLQEYVFLLGKVDDKTKKLLYNISDIFILPNIPVEGDIEGLGVVLLEAMACKIPIIGTNIGGIPDVIKNNETGLLVEPRNSKKLSKAIITLLTNKELRRKISEKGYMFVKNNFSWDKIAKDFHSSLKAC